MCIRDRLLETTKQKVAAFNQREDVKNGKEKLNEMTGKVTNAFSDGVDELMKKLSLIHISMP